MKYIDWVPSESVLSTHTGIMLTTFKMKNHLINKEPTLHSKFIVSKHNYKYKINSYAYTEYKLYV